MSLVLLCSALFVGAGCSPSAPSAGNPSSDAGVVPSVQVAQAASDNARNENAPGQYIVVLKDDTSDADAAEKGLSKDHGLGVSQSYRNVMKGFAANVPAGKLQALKADARVAFVSEDLSVQALVMPEANARGGNPPTTQPAQRTPTGIARVRSLVNTNRGTGIGVAVLDTGIDLGHPDLAANIVANTGCLQGKKTGQDDHGHGTHVAGTIAALNNAIGVVGVAPEARLAAVKVLNSQGSGTWSSIICGLDWVAANASRYGIKVANMSLGGTGSSDGNCGNSNNDALHRAICRLRDAGVTIVVAAGNSSADAALSVPSAYDDAVITVSALADSDGAPGGLGAATSYGPDDTFASFSNYGPVVDVGAPGAGILSTSLAGGYATMSGTSMASPHVAGAAALYIKSNPGSTWVQVRNGLKAAGELLGSGHTDPSGVHPEKTLLAPSL